MLEERARRPAGHRIAVRGRLSSRSVWRSLATPEAILAFLAPAARRERAA